MSITVQAIERGVLAAYGRAGGWMAAVGMATTASGSNADLAGPIAQAMHRAGLATAGPAEATDADLAGVPDSRYEEIVDRARLRTLESIQGSLSQVSTTSMDLTVQWEQLSRRVADEITRLSAEVLDRYGPGFIDRGPMLATGRINLPSTCERPFDNRWPPRQGYLGGPY